MTYWGLHFAGAPPLFYSRMSTDFSPAIPSNLYPRGSPAATGGLRDGEPPLISFYSTGVIRALWINNWAPMTAHECLMVCCGVRWKNWWPEVSRKTGKSPFFGFKRGKCSANKTNQQRDCERVIELEMFSLRLLKKGSLIIFVTATGFQILYLPN